MRYTDELGTLEPWIAMSGEALQAYEEFKDTMHEKLRQGVITQEEFEGYINYAIEVMTGE